MLQLWGREILKIELNRDVLTKRRRDDAHELLLVEAENWDHGWCDVLI